MSKTHTPGPWKLHWSQSPKNMAFSIYADTPEFRNRPLAFVEAHGMESEFSQANAHLIAAAPEMLGWLQAVERQLSYEVKIRAISESSGSGGMLPKLREMIAKAEGRVCQHCGDQDVTDHDRHLRACEGRRS